MTASARVGTFRGESSVRLTAGSTSFTVLPALGMLGASLRHRGGEYVSLHGGPAAFVGGHTTGVPLLAPWANRLAGERYRVGRTSVDVSGCAGVGRDGNGLPMHGTLLGRHVWDVVDLEADLDREVARLSARFPFGGHAELLSSFPFPHDLDVDIDVAPGRVQITTSVTPTSRRSVPVCFGWHPYFRIPGVHRRSDLVVGMPAAHRLELDASMIPTGRESRWPAEEKPLGRRTFDHAFRLGRTRRFRLVAPDAGGEARSLTVEMVDGYPNAQVYAPAGRSFVAFEPMTAPAAALDHGGFEMVSAGSTFSATFALQVT